METTTPDFTWLFIKMISGLVLVLALAVVLVRFVLPRTRFAKTGRSTWVRIIDRYPLEPNKHLYIVKIAGRYLVLGSADHSVGLITELSKAEGEKIETS